MTTRCIAAVLALILAVSQTTAGDSGPVHLQLVSSPNSARQRPEDVAKAAALRRDVIFRDFERPGPWKRQTDKSDWVLSNRANYRYSVLMAFGTPPQDFLIDVDTGSSELWVYDNSCTAEMCGSHSSGFEASRSSTYKDAGILGEVTYVSSYCRGPTGYDTVGVTNGETGSQRSTVAVEQQPFFRCSNSTTTLSQHEAPGNLGLAWYTKGILKPFWLNLVDGWQDKRFSMYFAKQNDSDFEPTSQRSQNGGVLTLGGLNTSLFVGEIDYIPMSKATYRNNTPYFWEVPVDHAEYDGRQFSNNTIAIVDTGTPTSTIPADLFKAIYEGLPGAVLSTSDGSTYYSFPCQNAIAQLRPLTLTLNGRQYTIPAEDLVLHNSPSDRTCFSTLDPEDDRYPFQWVLGDTFLVQVYTVYQYSPPAVGFARLPGQPVDNAASTNAAGPSTVVTGSGGGATQYPSSTPSGVSSGATVTSLSLGTVVLALLVAVLM